MGLYYIIYIYINARVMKFIPKGIKIMFSRFLALIWFLIIKTFNLREIQGLDLTASIINSQQCGVSTLSWRICLAIPKEGVLFHGTISLNTIKGDEMWLHMILDNGVHQTRCNVNLQKELCHYYLGAKGNTAYYQCMIRVIMIALIMRIVLNQLMCL